MRLNMPLDIDIAPMDPVTVKAPGDAGVVKVTIAKIELWLPLEVAHDLSGQLRRALALKPVA